MKTFTSLMLGMMLMAGTAFADGFGFNIGPFDMQFGVRTGSSDGSYVVERRTALDNPICAAISSQQQLGFTVEGKEIISTKEIKIVTKHLIVEPYAFGVTQDGKPILRGNVVNEKLIKEVSVKYGEERFDDSNREKGYSGWFKSSDKKNIDVENISDVQVIANSHFDAPKNYEGIKEENIKVICQIPVKAK